jgi:hypothetical protein
MYFLKCKEGMARNFMGRPKMSRKFKNSSFNNILSSNIKRYTSKIKMNSNIISNKSFTSIFKNENNNGFFLYNSLKFNSKIYEIFDLMFTEKEISLYSTKGAPLFNGELDELIDINNIKNEEDIEYLRKIESDYKTIYMEILKLCNQGARVCALSFVDDNSGLFHSISTVFWFSDGIFYCGLYDPMYFERMLEQYLWPTETLYILFKFLSKMYGIPMTIINLSNKFCLQTEKGKHCVQYMIDAEYCSMYCLYFLYVYARNSFPIDPDGLKKVVEETFIDNPSEITRSSCISTNKFLIVMMSFILTVVTLTSDNINILKKIRKVYDYIKNPAETYKEYNTITRGNKEYKQPPYELLHPSILRYLDEQIALLGRSNGGRRSKTLKKRRYLNNKPY